MIILGIESSCDETSVGVVEDGRKVLCNVVATSADMHGKYGGIVPEVAAREQVKVIVPVLREALLESRVESRDINAIAVAYGPGLAGSLLVGVETAKALVLAWNKPLLGVNHLVGHLYANWIEEESRVESLESRKIGFPAIGLVVSGGHTDLVLMESHTKIKHLGGTLDDAAGEVFDKVARVLGLGYPGGPEIERAASKLIGVGDAGNVNFPVPMSSDKSFDFSFSGLKTAVVNYVSTHRGVDVSQTAFAFQEAVVKSLVKKTFDAAGKYRVKSVVIGGGVASNGRLREKMELTGKNELVKVFFPIKEYSIDNGSMIASAAFYNANFIELTKMQADPGLYFV